MFNKVLVPLDGTPEAAVALPLACTMAQAGSGQLVLVRVTSAEYPKARQYLAGVAAELANTQLVVSTEVRNGDVPSEILGAIRDHQADLVVMATHGRKGLQRAVMGSVAEVVLARGTVPVLLVRPGGKPTTCIRTLLVRVDGTPGGALALTSATAVARSAGARIVLLEIVAPIPRWSFALAPAVPLRWDEEARDGAQAYVDALAARLQEANVEAEGRALIGDVAPTIVTVADEVGADLIVMGTRALVGATRAVIGSTGDAVVRTARRPVLLVRRVVPAAQSPAEEKAVELAPVR